MSYTKVNTQQSQDQQARKWDSQRTQRRKDMLNANRDQNEMEVDENGYNSNEYANMFNTQQTQQSQTQQTQQSQTQQQQRKRKYLHSPFSKLYASGQISKWKPRRSYQKWRRRILKKNPQTAGYEVTKKRYKTAMGYEKLYHEDRMKALDRVTYNTFEVQTPEFELYNNTIEVPINTINPLYNPDIPPDAETNPMYTAHMTDFTVASYYPIDLITNNIIGSNEATGTELVSIDTAIDLIALTPGITLTDFSIRLVYLPNPRDLDDMVEPEILFQHLFGSDDLNDVYKEQYILMKNRINPMCKTLNSAQYIDNKGNPFLTYDAALQHYAKKLPYAFPVSMYSQLDNKTLLIKKYHNQSFPSNGVIHKKLTYRPPRQQLIKLLESHSIFAIVSFIYRGLHESNMMAISARSTVGFIQY